MLIHKLLLWNLAFLAKISNANLSGAQIFMEREEAHKFFKIDCCFSFDYSPSNYEECDCEA